MAFVRQLSCRHSTLSPSPQQKMMSPFVLVQLLGQFNSQVPRLSFWNEPGNEARVDCPLCSRANRRRQRPTQGWKNICFCVSQHAHEIIMHHVKISHYMESYILCDQGQERVMTSSSLWHGADDVIMHS